VSSSVGASRCGAFGSANQVIGPGLGEGDQRSGAVLEAHRELAARYRELRQRLVVYERELGEVIVRLNEIEAHFAPVERDKRLFAYDFASNTIPGIQPWEAKVYWRD